MNITACRNKICTKKVGETEAGYYTRLSKSLTQYMPENSLFFTLDCCNIHLWRKMACAKNIAYVTYNNF